MKSWDELQLERIGPYDTLNSTFHKFQALWNALEEGYKEIHALHERIKGEGNDKFDTALQEARRSAGLDPR